MNKRQNKSHLTALHLIEKAFYEQQSDQSFTVHRHGQQVNEFVEGFMG